MIMIMIKHVKYDTLTKIIFFLDKNKKHFSKCLADKLVVNSSSQISRGNITAPVKKMHVI